VLCWCDYLDGDQLSATTWARQCQDTGRFIRIAAAVVIIATVVWRFNPEQASDPRDIGRTVAISEEAIVTDAVLASGQDVDQEPAYELCRSQRHGGVAARAFKTVVFDAEGDTTFIETDQSAVGNGDPVRVTRQIRQNSFGSCEGFFGINDPVDLAQWFEEVVEVIPFNEP